MEFEFSKRLLTFTNTFKYISIMAKRIIKHNFKRPIHQMASKDECRPAMNYIIIENGCLVATDAHMIIIQSLELHGFDQQEIQTLEGCCIHRKDFAAILKFDTIQIERTGITAKKGDVKEWFSLKKLEDMDFNYPNYKPFIPHGKTQEVDSIGFNLAFSCPCFKSYYGMYWIS